MARAPKGKGGGGTVLLRKYPGLKRLALLGRRRQIPMVQQMTATECGAACLTMVLGYFGREVGLEEVRDICGASRDGVSALQLLRAAEPLALRARGIRVDVDQLEMLEPGATILHWQFAHWVVFAGVTRNYVEINDPGVGRRKIPFDQFSKDFTGVALVFEPTQAFVKQARKKVIFATIKKQVLSTGLIPKILVISLILQLFHMAMPLLTGQLIDRVLPRGDFDLLTILMVGIGVMVIFQSLATLVRGQLLLHLTTLLDVRMTLGFLDHLVSLPYSYFQLRGTGDLMQRMHSNAVVRETLTSTTLSSVLDGLFVVVYLGVLFTGNLPMALCAVAAGAIDVSVYLLMRDRQRELSTQGIDVDTKAASYQMELLNSIETLKASGNEQRAVGQWSNLFVDSLNVQLNRTRLGMKTDAWIGVLKTAGPLAIMTTGAVQCLHGQLTIGSMLALNAVSGEFLGPLANLVGMAMSLEVMRTYMDRVNDVLEAEPEQDPEKCRPAPKLSGRVSLERVCFRYAKEGPMTVEDVSVDINAGDFVALVGRSGSGKSTLANLILGLYKPISGRITFDGNDMAELDLRSVRRQLGIVNQKLVLFGATIRENIALSDPTLTLEQIGAAARLACIHDDVLAMPLGYQTPLVDGGGSLSGGQKQRLALARALVRQPAVLLLDEATSALDAVTEAQVQASLDALKCTRIVIAHRLSTVRRADKILVVEKGRVIEAGTHRELLAKRGFYAQLVATQMDQERSAEGPPAPAVPAEEAPNTAGDEGVTPASRLPPVAPPPVIVRAPTNGAPKQQLRAEGLAQAVGGVRPGLGRVVIRKAGEILSPAQRAKGATRAERRDGGDGS
jgi:ATP-binding cassette subfamily B protein